MPMPTISKQQVLAALNAAREARHGQGQGDDHDAGGLAELSMDRLAAQAGVSRATLFRLFGSQQNLLQELGLEPPPKVRGRILDTALELVGRHGLAELSMDELAAQAGVSRATLYRLFPGKMALFAELVRRFSPFEPIAAVLQIMGNRPPAEVIPAVAHAMATAMEGRIGLLLQLLLEVSRGSPDRPDSDPGTSQDVVQGMRTLPLVAHYLAEQMAAGRLRRMDPILAVQALTGPIVMHLLSRSQAASRPGAGRAVPLQLEQVVDELANLWLRAMTPDQGEHPPGRQHESRARSKHDGQPDTDSGADPAPPGRA
jgi:AcrR family transcriptional regulator